MKRYYEDEKTHVWPNILLAVLIVVCIGSMFICFKDDVPFEISIILVVFLSMFVFTFLYLILSNIINARKNRDTSDLFVSKGIKVSGKIIKEEHKSDIKYKNLIFKRAEYFGMSDRVSKMYRYTVLTVEYELNGEKKTTTTPPIDFSTSYLKDKNVNVYIYQDKCYVGNYNIDYKTKEKDFNEKNSYKIKLIVFVIVYMLLFTFVSLLAYYKIIGTELLKNIIFVLIGSFMAMCLFFFFKYYNKITNDIDKMFKEDEKKDNKDV